MTFSFRAIAAGALMMPFSVAADEAAESFVEGNLIAILYHELGHALIDIEGIPIFGQEEDAADVLSIFLIDAFFDEDAAQQTAFEAALGFEGEAVLRDEDEGMVAWWDVHGPDEQRYFNTVCLFYGADPTKREELATELGLPEDRADYCADEYDQAANSWGQVIDEISIEGGGESILFDPADGLEDTLTYEVVEYEVAFLNENLELSDDLVISVEPCDEANAYYDPEDRLIVMCVEFEDHLREMAEHL